MSDIFSLIFYIHIYTQMIRKKNDQVLGSCQVPGLLAKFHFVSAVNGNIDVRARPTGSRDSTIAIVGNFVVDAALLCVLKPRLVGWEWSAFAYSNGHLGLRFASKRRTSPRSADACGSSSAATGPGSVLEPICGFSVRQMLFNEAKSLN